MKNNRNESPYFSIVIPMYNREKFIGRALDSCLNQDFLNYEIVVVDDGSTDGSAAVVEGYYDPRLTFLRHPVNRGVGPARNKGGDSARGEWLIFLDSDDELLPGALSVIAQRCKEVGEEIASLRFMYRLDNGTLSPYPALQNEIWDYNRYFQVCETYLGHRQDSLLLVRSRTFEQVRFSVGRGLEGTYHFDFARLFFIRTCSEVLALCHQDADNQLTRNSVSQLLLSAPDLARDTVELLARHGEALRALAPRVYWQRLSGLVTLYFLAGNRHAAWCWALRCLRHKPASAKIWAILALGSLGCQPLAWLKVRKTRRSLKKFGIHEK